MLLRWVTWEEQCENIEEEMDAGSECLHDLKDITHWKYKMPAHSFLDRESRSSLSDVTYKVMLEPYTKLRFASVLVFTSLTLEPVVKSYNPRIQSQCYIRVTAAYFPQSKWEDWVITQAGRRLPHPGIEQGPGGSWIYVLTIPPRQVSICQEYQMIKKIRIRYR